MGKVGHMTVRKMGRKMKVMQRKVRKRKVKVMLRKVVLAVQRMRKTTTLNMHPVKIHLLKKVKVKLMVSLLLI